jgi:hypothetical protein
MRLNLKTAVTYEADPAAVYTLYLYGGRYSDDPETVAILMKEPVRYTVDIYAPDFNFKTVREVPGGEAIERTFGFISRHSAYAGNIMSEISDQQGIVIGYEIRPLYQTTTYGIPDVLDINYRQNSNKITVYIKLKPLVEQMIRGGGG